MKSPTAKAPSSIQKQRSSNLELFRSLAMLLIVLHHYIATSGLIPVLEEAPFSTKAMFAMILGAWGKPAINCFVLITGYFMCTSNITLKKFAKLLLEVYFYKIVIYVIFLATGYAKFTINNFLRVIIGPFSSVASNFTGCFLLFFLLIPFINKLINTLNKKMHLLLIVLCLFIYTVMGSISGISTFNVKMNYVSWFTVLYLIASYIRLYPNSLTEKTSLWGIMTAVAFLLGNASVAVGYWLSKRFNMTDMPYFFVSDSNKFLALAFGITSFLFFKNLRLPTSKVINAIGGTTFGVLCIHSNGAIMRQWLWGSFLKVTEAYQAETFFIHAIVSTLGVFIACSLLDLARIHFIEAPFFRLWDKCYPSLSQKYFALEEKIKSRFAK